MNVGRSEAAHLVEQMGFCVMGQVVGLSDAESRVDRGVDLGPQGMADPADVQLPDFVDPRDTGDRRRA
jgi:hypothetical protein